MTSLQGLPPLPASLQSLLHAGSAHWKEMDRINQMKNLIQQEYSADANHVAVQSNLIENENGTKTDARNGEDGASINNRSLRKTFKVTPHNIQSAIAHLQQEMLSLRQLDVSLLYQLWGLNELLQDVKALRERTVDSISECSVYSLDQSDDRIDEEDEMEHDYENTPNQHDRYVNQFFHRAVMNNDDDDEGLEDEEDENIYEPVYLQPLPSGPPPPVPSAPPPRKPVGFKEMNTTYESNC